MNFITKLSAKSFYRQFIDSQCPESLSLSLTSTFHLSFFIRSSSSGCFYIFIRLSNEFCMLSIKANENVVFLIYIHWRISQYFLSVYFTHIYAHTISSFIICLREFHLFYHAHRHSAKHLSRENKKRETLSIRRTISTFLPFISYLYVFLSSSYCNRIADFFLPFIRISFDLDISSSFSWRLQIVGGLIDSNAHAQTTRRYIWLNSEYWIKRISKRTEL